MKSRTLYINEKTTTEDANMEFVTSKYQLHQIINESIHVIETPFFVLISFLHHNKTW